MTISWSDDDLIEEGFVHVDASAYKFCWVQGIQVEYVGGIVLKTGPMVKEEDLRNLAEAMQEHNFQDGLKMVKTIDGAKPWDIQHPQASLCGTEWRRTLIKIGTMWYFQECLYIRDDGP